MWIGSYQVFADVARFVCWDQRKIGVVHKENPDTGNGSKVATVVSTGPNSYVDILMGTVIVDNVLSVKVVDVEMIPNLPKVCMAQGFYELEIRYVGDDDKDEHVASGRVCILTSLKRTIMKSVSMQVGDVDYEVWIKEFASWAPTIQRPMEGDSMEWGPNEDDHLYSLVGSFQSNVELDTNVRPDPINQEESDDTFSSYDVIEELNDQEKSKVEHVTTESKHVEAVAVELVVPSHQETINKVVIDTMAEVVNESQETTEGLVASPSTPPTMKDLKNRNTNIKSFASDLEVNVVAWCDNGSSSGTIPKGPRGNFEAVMTEVRIHTIECLVYSVHGYLWLLTLNVFRSDNGFTDHTILKREPYE
ncbi:hypothetical protein L1987_18103 [Smallanthus sonchifolius]|uniref:Uncharacterized protein n=1 Tax=Smallanthus sonchifolius TaxID=185202 RepID=A0ACB9IZU1_9ASTR|nr:hypothetical protein L1987_18103 [Smallanthus sonchifolius]